VAGIQSGAETEAVFDLKENLEALVTRSSKEAMPATSLPPLRIVLIISSSI
jgi:hypothetical protein